MVLLTPDNANPTMAEIDMFLRCSPSSSYEHTIREIRSKSGVNALLHPAEEYFLEAAEAVGAAARITP